MTSYKIPAEPHGPVWDKYGNQWVKNLDGPAHHQNGDKQMRKHLPGNPFNPAQACTCRDPLMTEHEESWLEETGMTDATMMFLAIQKNTLATMALAYEQRTANLIAIYGPNENREPKTDDEINLWNVAIVPRLGLRNDEQKETNK